jgi:hypothetical protein
MELNPLKIRVMHEGDYLSFGNELSNLIFS